MFLQKGGAVLNNRKIDYSVYLVTDSGEGEDFCRIVEKAVTGGVTMVQLREKTSPTRGFYELALRVKKITTAHGVPLIINDRLDIALAVDAEGLHVGQEDLPVAVARRLLGDKKILGATAASVRDALAAEQDGADYLGSGAVYPTSTKPGKQVLSLKEFAKIKQAVRIPVVAIGGITAGNMIPVLQAGADGVAVVSAIMSSADPASAANMFKNIWQKQRLK